MFLAADYPEGKTNDGEYLAKKLDEAIKIVEALKMKPLLGSIVTENAAEMLKANKVLDNEEEYPDRKYLIRTGCVLHQHNLFYKDLCQLEYFALTRKESRDIINFF